MLGSKKFTFHIFFKLRVVGRLGRKNIGGCWNRPKKITSQTIKVTQKDIMGVRNINV
jgi:hypothetical protein